MDIKFIYILITGIALLSCNAEQNRLRNSNIINSHKCFVYIDVSYKGCLYTVISKATSFYANLNHYQYDDTLTKEQYFKIMNKVLNNNSPLEINDSMYVLYQYYILDSNLINKYDTIDLIKSKYIIGQHIIDSIGKDDQHAIIYTLLKKELKNCCQVGEARGVIILEPKYPLKDNPSLP